MMRPDEEVDQQQQDEYDSDEGSILFFETVDNENSDCEEDEEEEGNSEGVKANPPSHAADAVGVGLFRQQLEQQQSSLAPATAASAASKASSSAAAASFDPYNPANVRQTLSSLLDDEEDDNATVATAASNPVANDAMNVTAENGKTHSSNHFLEMEQEYDDDDPSERTGLVSGRRPPSGEEDEQIQTRSGLLLTHRSSNCSNTSAGGNGANGRREIGGRYDEGAPATSFPPPSSTTPSSGGVQQRRRPPQQQQQQFFSDGPPSSSRQAPPERSLEVEHAYAAGGGAHFNNHNNGYFSSAPSSRSGGMGPLGGATTSGAGYYSYYANNAKNPLQHAKRMLSYVRLWVIASAIVLLSGTAVVIKHIRHEHASRGDGDSAASGSSSSIRVVSMQDQVDDASAPIVADTVVLLPLDTSSYYHSSNNNGHYHRRLKQHQHVHHRFMTEMEQYLFQEFYEWMLTHEKAYGSDQEQQLRFGVWVDNHHKTRAKNARHGPCQLTGKPVFGSTVFQDLTEQEFHSKYLTGYNAPRKPEEKRQVSNSKSQLRPPKPPVLGDRPPRRHEHVHRRIQETFWKESDDVVKQTNYKNCKWYDVSCYLRFVFETYFYGLGRTMEPAYDADSYPMGKLIHFSVRV